MRNLRLIAIILLCVSLTGGTLTAQAAGRPDSTPASSTPSSQLPDATQGDPSSLDPQIMIQKEPKSAAQERAEQQLEKERQKQRWQDIKKRSEQLLELATELKQYVDKSGENVMSVEVIKKAEQMEKLAKDLQKKMKGD